MATATVERRPTGVSPGAAQGGQVFAPNVDVVETADELLLLADVPGARPDTIDVNFQQGELSISARVEPRQREQTRFLAREYAIGDYYRVFRVGETIDSSRIHAELNAGVLKVHLPKAENAKPRKIQVKAG